MNFKYYIRYWLFQLLMFSTSVLPLRFGYWVSLRISDLGYFLGDRKGRKAIMRNLRHVFPDEPESRIIYEARWVFRNWGKYLTEFFRFRCFTDEFFLRHTSSIGIENAFAALEKKKGAIIISAHVSNWELGAAYMMRFSGAKVAVVAAQHVYDKIDRLFVSARELMGIEVIYTHEAGRKVLRALRENKVVCILGDRDVTDTGVEVEFFGQPCKFPQGPARLALKAGAALIPGFVLRRTNDSFVITYQEPIPFPEGVDKDEQVRVVLQEYARRLEKVIREHPEEWPAFYDVWDEKWIG